MERKSFNPAHLKSGSIQSVAEKLVDGVVPERRFQDETLDGAFPLDLRVTEPPPEYGHAYYKYYTFLRPEQLRVSTTGAGPSAQVEAVLFEGGQRTLILNAGNSLRLTARSLAAEPFSVGQEVHVAVEGAVSAVTA